MTDALGKSDLEVCIHEAAHLVVACKLQLSTPDTVTVEPREDYSGRITDPGLIGPEWKRTFLRDNPGHELNFRKEDEMYVVMRLAGMVASDRIVFPPAVSARQHHEETVVFYVDEGDEMGDMARDLKQTFAILNVYESDPEKLKAWLLDLLDRTYRFVDESWDDIRRVASFLQERRTLDREGIEEAYRLIEGKEG